nr:uncharacterized protein LOC124809412 [Hydra vulgaris]
MEFAENFINGEDLVKTFSLEEVIIYRNDIVHCLISRGGQKNWKDVLCRLCGKEKGPKTHKKHILDKWIKCDKCLPSRWYHMDCIPNVLDSSNLFTCANISP